MDDKKGDIERRADLGEKVIALILSMWNCRSWQEIQVDIHIRELKIWVLNSRNTAGLVGEIEDHQQIDGS